MKLQRVHALTGIRAVAAIMVFLYHNRKYWREDIPFFLLRFLNEFHTGVSVFFVLSGFLIAYTYKDEPLRSRKNYLKYLLIRLARIFPVYLAILLLKLANDGFLLNKETFLTFTLLHGFSDKYNLSGIPQAWSLCVELSFYTLAPYIYSHVKKSPIRAFLLLSFLLLLVLGVGYGWHAATGNKDYFLYPSFFVLNATFPGRFPEFLWGMLLARYLHANPAPALSRNRATLAGGLGALAIIYGLSFLEPDIYRHGTDHPAGLAIRNLVFPGFITLFLYGLITEKTAVQKFLSSKPLILLGNASFAFYLVHIGYVNMKLRNLHLFPDRNFILLWLVAITVYFLIEKPVYERLRRLIRQW